MPSRTASGGRAVNTSMAYALARAMTCALAALALAGCDDAIRCAHDGQTLSEGESTDDLVRRLRCTCTARGLICEDLPGVSGLGDAAVDMAPDAAPRVDAAPVDRGPPPDAAPDAMPDAAPPDARPPPTCPAERIVDGSDCPGRSEGLECLDGPGFDCCGRAVPAERRCACEARTWSCTDLIAECESDPIDGDCGRRSRLCQRWLAVRDVEDPRGDWAGNHDLCVEGDMTPDWRARTLDLINTYRSIAGLRPVRLDAGLDRLAQLCALAVFWHRTDDHRLEPADRCHSDRAARGVEASLISVVPALAAVEEYMLDFGEPNFDSMTHRLYLLAPQLGPIGLGSTSDASCVYVFDGRGPRDDPPWVAWPAPGPFPVDAAHTRDAGWTVHGNGINLAFAEARVTVDGVEQAIEQRSLRTAGPAGWGIAWMPQGWDIEAGRRYRVEVTGGIRQGEPYDFEYTVEAIDCDAPAP